MEVLMVLGVTLSVRPIFWIDRRSFPHSWGLTDLIVACIQAICLWSSEIPLFDTSESQLDYY